MALNVNKDHPYSRSNVEESMILEVKTGSEDEDHSESTPVPSPGGTVCQSTPVPSPGETVCQSAPGSSPGVTVCQSAPGPNPGVMRCNSTPSRRLGERVWCINCSEALTRDTRRHTVCSKLRDVGVTVNESLKTNFSFRANSEKSCVCGICYQLLATMEACRIKMENTRAKFIERTSDDSLISTHLDWGEEIEREKKKRKIEREKVNMKKRKEEDKEWTTTRNGEGKKDKKGEGKKDKKGEKITIKGNPNGRVSKVCRAVGFRHYGTALRHLAQTKKGEAALWNIASKLLIKEIGSYKKTAVITTQPLTLSNIQTFSFPSLNEEFKSGLPHLHSIISRASTTRKTVTTNHIPLIISCIIHSRTSNRFFKFFPQLISLLLSCTSTSRSILKIFYSMGMSLSKDGTRRAEAKINKEIAEKSADWIRNMGSSIEGLDAEDFELIRNVTATTDEQISENTVDEIQIASSMIGDEIMMNADKGESLDNAVKLVKKVVNKNCLQRLLIEKLDGDY